MPDKAVFLINIGTPDQPSETDVRKYLSEFLNDKNVIDIPGFFRWILVNGIIIPFRTKKSTALYKRLWTQEGSPLSYNLNRLTEKIGRILGPGYKVIAGMRYGKPSLAEAIRRVRDEGISHMVFVPLYPQYASSTTGSTIEIIEKELKQSGAKYHIVQQFYDHPAYLKAFSSLARKYKPQSFDHVIFSYHGLPLRHVRKIHPGTEPLNCECKEIMPSYGRNCYRAACYETTRLLAPLINLETEQYSVTFQSRLSRNWLSPFTEETLVQLAGKGKKRVLVFAPSFVSDCLETLIEIKEEAAATFRAAGGEELVLADSLNDNDEWANALASMVVKG